MSDDDFLKAMGDVKPIQQERRVTLKKDSLNSDSARARRKAAMEEVAQELNELSGGDDHIEPLDPNAILEFQRPGVQHGVYRNLRLGKYAIDARLDLHHHTIDQARTAVRAFVRDCIQHDIRCALITHGKGEGRKQPALLKSCVAHWLPQLEDVLAFHSAQKQHGGGGATYIMLRKSEKKRQDNLELHQRRRPV
jgi:DNA-nicking Smr family endonuclease